MAFIGRWSFSISYFLGLRDAAPIAWNTELQNEDLSMHETCDHRLDRPDQCRLRSKEGLEGGTRPAICLIQKVKPFKFLPFMLSDHMRLLKKFVS